MASLYFKYAAMNSGKSTQLLQAHYNYAERGMHPMAMTAALDDRSGSGVISSRLGITSGAETFEATTDIHARIAHLHAIKKIDALLIDEAQFLSRAQVEQLARVVDDFAIPVLCYGLKTDFRGRLFEGSEALLCLADNIEEIKALCWCGRKATMTARVVDGQMTLSGDQVAIGGNDMYTSLCRKHFMRHEHVAAAAREKAA